MDVGRLFFMMKINLFFYKKKKIIYERNVLRYLSIYIYIIYIYIFFIKIYLTRL